MVARKNAGKINTKKKKLEEQVAANWDNRSLT